MEWNLPCGCSMFLEPNSPPVLTYCPLHKSAPDLYEACKMLVNAIERDCTAKGEIKFTIHRDSPFVDTFRKAILKVESK